MKSKSTSGKILMLAIVLILVNTKLAFGGIHYVNLIAAGANTGTSWTDAFVDLQSAIDVAVAGDEIWVAEGTYFPTKTHGDTSSRNKTFYITLGIKLIGGFEGLPGTEGDFGSRNVTTHKTILSGDLGLPLILDDNAFHVMYLDHTGSDLVIDGFAIRDGYGHEGAPLDNSGAGIFNDGSVTGSSNPTFLNCIIDHNSSNESGGGFFNWGSDGEANPLFINSIFTNNSASGGGAIANLANPNGSASPTIINSEFRANSAPTAGGGAITNIGVSGGNASPTLYNCLFSGNFSPTSGAFHSFSNAGGNTSPLLTNCTFAGNSGGAVSTSSIGGSTASTVIKNSIFWNNSGGGGIFENGSFTTVTFSLVPFGAFPGEGNLSLNPEFVSETDFNLAPTLTGDLHLTEGSIAIDAGSNEALNPNIATDLDGNLRISPDNGTVDMGAYEFKTTTTATKQIELQTPWDLSPNPASDVVNITFPPEHGAGLIRLISPDGKMALQQFIEPHSSTCSIQTNKFSKGVYMFQLVLDGKMATRKLILE